LNPPILILISGASLTGKSTLAEFLRRHISTEKDNNNVKKLSTE